MRHKTFLFLITLNLLFFAQPNPIFAIDELHLCGKIEEIDKNNRIIIADISSESCRGVRKFSYTENININSISTNDSFCFVLKSSQCFVDNIGAIAKIENVVKRHDN